MRLESASAVGGENGELIGVRSNIVPLVERLVVWIGPICVHTASRGA
jgi:hypothetical protein